MRMTSPYRVDMEEALPRLARMAALRRLRLESVLLLLCCMMLSPLPASAADGESIEYAVKAAYLYKFGIYIQWPRAAFASPTSELNLCIVGDDPFGTTLDEAIRGQRIDGRPIAIRRFKAGSLEPGCHILYLGMHDAQAAARELTAHATKGILTVSDFRGIGMISFVIKDNRVRFDIDEDAAARNGISISSKLLDLALSVKPRQGAP